MAQHVSAVILDGTDNIVLTIFSGLKAVSVYSVYNLVVSGVKQLLLSMTNGIQSLIGVLWGALLHFRLHEDPRDCHASVRTGSE